MKTLPAFKQKKFVMLTPSLIDLNTPDYKCNVFPSFGITGANQPLMG